MSDFLSWDTDLDLDLLLEEYTEYEPSDSGSADYDCSTAKKKKTNTSVVFHQGLFQLCNQGSDLLTLSRPGRMTLRRTPIRL
jgi:hypothetical protein